MKAKTIKESLNFKRGEEPKDIMGTGFKPFIHPDDISFKSGRSEQGYHGGDNPKITVIIKGQTTKAGKAFLRGGNDSIPGTEEINNLIVEFLNSPETRLKISDILEKTKTDWEWKTNRK